MKLELDKKDLVHLVCGIQPPLQMFDVLENSGLGERTGGFPFNTWEWDTRYLEKLEEQELFELYNKIKSLWETVTKHLGKSFKYEYEIYFDESNEPCPIKGWFPIATDRIKDQSKIEHYIKTGLLRRIKK